MQSIKFTLLYALCIYFSLFGMLGAENKDLPEKFIQKGRILYDIALGLEQVENLSAGNDKASQSYLRYLVSDPLEYKLFGFAGIQDSNKKIGVTGNNQKITLEYLFHDWIGIGGTLQNSFITSSNLSKNDTELNTRQYQDIQLTAIFFPELQQGSDLYNVYGLSPDKNQIESIRTYDYDLTFHVPNQGNLDPYFRISAGRGFLTADLVGRTGWSTGVRWRTSEKFFLESDIYQSRLLSKNSSGEENQYLENGIRFGMGFFSTWPPVTAN